MTDIPFWVWAAAAAGTAGAVGAIIGWALERSGHKWGRWVSVLALVSALSFIRTDAFKNYVSRVTISDAQVENALVSASPALWSYLKNEFPEDYRLVTLQMKEIVRTELSLDSAQRKAGEATQSLRRKYAKFALYGDDASFSEVLSATLSLTRALQVRDPALCARFAIEGGMAFVGTPLMREYGDELEASAISIFKSIRSGIDNPILRSEPKDEDWIVVTDIMSGFGASEKDFNSIASPIASDPNLCGAMIRLLEAIVQVPGASGATLRGGFVRDVAAG